MNTNSREVCKECKRWRCKFYNEKFDNNCQALRQVYEDDYECAFFKRKFNPTGATPEEKSNGAKKFS